MIGFFQPKGFEEEGSFNSELIIQTLSECFAPEEQGDCKLQAPADVEFALSTIGLNLPLMLMGE